MPGSIDAFVVDRDLAILLSESEEDGSGPVGEPTIDDVVDAMAPYDESAMSDPFAEIPKGMS